MARWYVTRWKPITLIQQELKLEMINAALHSQEKQAEGEEEQEF